MTEIITPKDQAHWLDLRTRDITSTEVSALFGISPYLTEFELYHRKKNGFSVPFEETEWIKWGTRLQDAIADGLAKDHGWSIRRMDEYIRDPELRMGSSFDFAIEESDQVRKEYGAPGGILEVKNVGLFAFKDGWIVDGDNIEAPPHIEIQVQHQLAVSGRAYVVIGALVGGNTPKIIRREPDLVVIKAIRERVAEFWKRVDSNTPPEPNFEKDAKFISRLYGFADPGKIYDASLDEEIQTLAKKYKEMGDAIKQCDETREAMKAQILMKIGSAEKVTGGAFTISAGMIGPAHVEYDREGYRSFKITWKKK